MTVNKASQLIKNISEDDAAAEGAAGISGKNLNSRWNDLKVGDKISISSEDGGETDHVYVVQRIRKSPSGGVVMQCGHDRSGPSTGTLSLFGTRPSNV